MQSLSASLDKLSSQLKPNQFNQLKKCYPNESHQNILLKKGVYPYSYMDNMLKFEDKCLPSELDFYNDLEDKEMTKKNSINMHKKYGKYLIV